MFEQTLSPESENRGGYRKSRFFPAALAVHAAGLAVVLGVSIWNVDEPPEPPVPVIWIAPVSAAPAPAARGTPLRNRPSSRASRETHAAPVAISDRIPVAAAMPETEPDSSGEGPPGPQSEGVGPGAGDGIDGGWDPAGGRRTGGVEEILTPGGDVRAPVLVRRVEPIYPEAARKARLEGIVILEAIITAAGEIEEVRVVKSAGGLLDTSAEEAVRRWRYRPATLNGRGVRVLLTVTISFRVH